MMTLGSTPIQDYETASMEKLQDDVSQLEGKLNINTEDLIDDILAKIDNYDDDEGLYKFLHDEKGIDISSMKVSIETLVMEVHALERALKEWKRKNQGEAPM